MLQISGCVSGLVVIVCFAKFLFKKPLINIVILFDVLYFMLGLFAKDERKKYLQLHNSSRQVFLCITGKLKSASICCEMQPSFHFCFGRIIQLTLKADSFDRFGSFHDNWIPVL